MRLFSNARSLGFSRRIDAESRKIAHYPFETTPPPGSTEPHPPDRKDGQRRAGEAGKPPGEAGS